MGAAHEARGEALQAARLAQLVTVELRQAQARLEAEAALVGAREGELPSTSQEARSSTLGELVELSEPAISTYEERSSLVERAVEGGPPPVPTRDDELGLG